MGDGFLLHYMVVYIGKEIVAKFNINEIIDLFDRPCGVEGRRYTSD